ncbi:glycosyltransferase family 4 protein [Cellulophaga baltica]|uniref:glycosyltransferase family 4 protein n=1 Tax=Cellulophaga TaxID=104264 RepID=UPI001C07628A|nr:MULTISPECIES: glycosyltransferase family 1 protein [Cellulophaga]MBU2995643.1 glycosyltransferase family 4 protein [Cellulophaga baltica]MDO6767037.1 glycosyltransferase family 1 protein [Cellulophaga sp. 1_MG-2023]
MKLIFIIHQQDSLGYSMKRYENILNLGLQKRGHETQIWAPKLYLSKKDSRSGLSKWLRYIDVYFLFPIVFHWKNRLTPKDTLYILIDQALGIWTPLIKNRKHVIHCHDFIALKSSLGLIKENPISKTGKIYQNLILKGFSKADNFIAISKNTQRELLSFLQKQPKTLEQVYNPIDPKFTIGDTKKAKIFIENKIDNKLQNGYILHVGGNTFYKNRAGVIQLYQEWRTMSDQNLPLLMIGSSPCKKMVQLQEQSPFSKDIYFLTKVSDETLVKAYQGATLFLFPSLLEGFGFPVAEAMACGCPVITTDAMPMNEVGGTAAHYIKSMPSSPENKTAWLKESALIVEKMMQLTESERKNIVQKGLEHCAIFNEKTILNQIEKIYLDIIKS